MKVIGHPTPRIDAAERVTGKANYTRDVYLRRHAVRARAAQSASARAHQVDRHVEGEGGPRRQGDCHAREREVVWGAGSIAGGVQYSDDIKKITTQRRYAFNNPVRFVGEPVAAVAAVDRHVAEEAARPDRRRLRGAAVRARSGRGAEARRAEDLAGRQSLAERAQPVGSRSRPETRQRRRWLHERGQGVRGSLQHRVRATTPRWSRASCVAHWEGDKLTVYTPTGGIANCHHDIARDLGIPDEKVRVICHYMGGNFGNKNQNQDADLITALLAKEAGAPVKLEFSRKDDFLGMHGRWPTMQYYKVGVKNDGTLHGDPAARLQRHGAVPQELRRRSAASSSTTASTSRARSHPDLHQPYDVGELPRAGVSAGLLPIQSLMDDIAYELKMDPVDFVLKNMTRSRATTVPFTNYTLDECIRRGAELFEWKKRWKPVPGPIPARSSAAPAWRSWRSVSGVGSSSAVITVDAKGTYTRVRRRHRRRRRREDDDGASSPPTHSTCRCRRSTSSGATPTAARTRLASRAAGRRS